MRRLGFAWIVLVAACSGDLDTSIRVDSITPNFAPLVGGTRIVIEGKGFLVDGAAPNRVVIGGREAPLAGAVDDGTLEVETPPADMAGEVPVIVFNRNGNVLVEAMFHYTAAPTVTAVSPADLVFDSFATGVTVTGTGFMADGAGVTRVLIDGKPAVDVEVVSDTSITFTAPRGELLTRPVLEVVNSRGTATIVGGFRYVPSLNPNLVVFTNRESATWAFAYDTVTGVAVPIARKSTAATAGFRAVYTDSEGALWGMESRPMSGSSTRRFGQIDLVTQRFLDPTVLPNTFPVMYRSGATIFAINNNTGQFGTLDVTDPKAPAFTSIVSINTNGVGLAHDGTSLFFADPNGISTINETTGVRGTIRPLTPTKHIGEMRFVGPTLYAITNQSPQGDLVTIDPATGAVTVVKSFNAQMSAIELLP